MKKLLIAFLFLGPFLGYSTEVDTITSKIIVVNEGYDRVSAIT